MEEVFSRTEQLLGRERFQKLRRCLITLAAGKISLMLKFPLPIHSMGCLL